MNFSADQKPVNSVPVPLECNLPEPKSIDTFARKFSEHLVKNSTATEDKTKIDQEFAEVLNFVARMIGKNLSRRQVKTNVH